MREEPFGPSPEVQSIWQECVRSVTNRIDSPVWRACLGDMEAVHIQENALKVRTGDFSRDLLSGDPVLGSAITAELTRVLQDLTHRELRLEWSLGEGRRVDRLHPSPGPPVSRDVPARDILHATPIDPPVQHRLNPKYTFDTFVEGSSNQLAYAAARSVAENPARSYNPLFLYGGVGLGKTHLMQAIGHGILQRNPSARVVYVSTETFMNDLIESLGNKSTASFRDKYRNVDVLLIDDIQFLINKERTQEEFFHTFNNLHSGDRQICITSDRPPHELHPLEDRLRSRFTQGLIADIQSPDVETREAILRKKVVEQFHVSVPHDVISFIAQRVPNSIRDLEGALIRVMAYASTHVVPIEIATAREALNFLLDESARVVNIRSIQTKVCEHFRIRMDDMLSERRDRKFAFPRQIAMYLSRQLTQASLKNIADEFNRKDHTTVIHAVQKIESEMSDPSTRENVHCIQEKLKECGT